MQNYRLSKYYFLKVITAKRVTEKTSTHQSVSGESITSKIFAFLVDGDRLPGELCSLSEFTGSAPELPVGFCGVAVST